MKDERGGEKVKFQGVGNDGQTSWKIINGDCIEEMKKMPSESVDYVFTSPPYNDSAKTNRDIETRRHAKYKDIEFREDWFEWQMECIDEMLRVAKKMVLYNVQAILSNKTDVYRLIGHYADRIHMILIWYKPNAQPQGYDHRIGNNYEMVLILKANQFDGLWCNSKNYNTVIVQNINSDRRYNGLHHAIMSQNFADEIITEFTQRGETVLDPFCGMATTGIACVNNHRNFIGIEIDKEYCEVGASRLFEDTAQIRMEMSEVIGREEEKKEMVKMMTMKAARVNAGLTQNEVAKVMGVSNVTISNWEKGKKYPTLIQAYNLAQIYGVTLNDFIIPTVQV